MSFPRKWESIFLNKIDGFLHEFCVLRLEFIPVKAGTGMTSGEVASGATPDAFFSPERNFFLSG